MNVYLAAPCNGTHCRSEIIKSPFLLESYYYFQDWETQLINDNFLLDSGAFTFMSKNKGGVDWELYVRKYAEFIKKNKIKLFLELDIDSIVGLKEVERLRCLLETITERQCIPVWHKSRGKENFIETVKRYDYVAIGGIVTKEIKRSEYQYFPWFINQAHKHSCKIHGLGFITLRDLSKYHFDSVDSSTWTSGRRFGRIYEFKNGSLITHSKKNARVVDYKKADIHNVREWIKYQIYARDHL